MENNHHNANFRTFGLRCVIPLPLCPKIKRKCRKKTQGGYVMRLIAFALAAAFVGVAASGANAQGCGCTNQANNAALSGPPCSAPNGYTLAPGCCFEYRPCCDNAWAGYCEQHAKMQAFWAGVGTPRPWTPLFAPNPPKAVRCGRPCVQPCSQPAPAPAAAAPVQPKAESHPIPAPTPAPLPPSIKTPEVPKEPAPKK
jgi:hypothetical protein